MDDIEYSQAIARLRRAQPRNAALQEVLDEAQLRLNGSAATRLPKVAVFSPANDRKAYMRELMRKRRAAAKAAKGE